MKTIRRGDHGSDVIKLQRFLGINKDGIFGPQTEKKVKEFQSKYELTADGIVGIKTWSVLEATAVRLGHDYCDSGYCQYTRQQIEDALKAKGYTYFKEDWLLNIVGIRNSETKNRLTNQYDDHMTVSYQDGNHMKYHCWPITTDPGEYWINHPMNTDGCAILVPGQYIKTYKITKHLGKYDALCQRGGRVSVYRDGNLDDIYDHDPESVDVGYFGINIHRSSAYRKGSYINKYSAGCQVFSDPDDFDDFMALAYKSKEAGYPWFTYTASGPAPRS